MTEKAREAISRGEKVRQIILNSLTALSMAATSVLAFADKISQIPGLPPEWAQWWPVLIPGILTLKAICNVAMDLADDGKINNSAKILAIIAGAGVTLCLAGCITLRGEYTDAQGNKVFSEYSRDRGLILGADIHERSAEGYAK